MLEITAYGSGMFRLRLGPNTRPDYGLIVARAKACTISQPSAGTWTLRQAMHRLKSPARRCGSGCCGRARPC